MDMFCYLLPPLCEPWLLHAKKIGSISSWYKCRDCQSFKFGFKDIETVLFISSIHLELRCFIFSYYVSMNGFTFACHALMVPSLLRRPRKGLQVPEYHLDAVELAVIWWSLISPLSIPRGTEQPKPNIYIEERLTCKDIFVILHIIQVEEPLNHILPLRLVRWFIFVPPWELHMETSYHQSHSRRSPCGA